MEATRGDPESPYTPVNGYRLAKEYPDVSAGEAATPNRSRANTNRETTRYLAAATQIDTKYAAEVVSIIFGQPLKALAPGYGIDVAIVARWAAKALRTQGTRDLILAAILMLQVLSVVLAINISAWLLIAIPALFSVAWIVVSWEYWERIHNCVIKQLRRDRFDPGDAPPPKHSRERTLLDDLARRTDGNLIVFSGPSAFAGTGETADSRRILFDISFTQQSENKESARKNENFTSHDIHLAMVKAFSNSHGLGKSLPNVQAYERLFVNGLHLKAGTDLLPDLLEPPRATVGSDVLAAAAINPTDESRSYVCVEMPGWHGQLVVTLFARAVYTGKSLFVEWTFRILPPLRKEFLQIDNLFELPRYQQALNSLSVGSHATVPMLIRSPVTALRKTLRPAALRARQSRLDYSITHGYVYDYGAARSIREDASGKNNTHFFLARDEKMYMLLAQQTLIQAVRNFLTEHGVALETFNRQVQFIVDNSIKIGDIKDSTGIAIGSDSSANVSSTPEGKNEQ